MGKKSKGKKKGDVNNYAPIPDPLSAALEEIYSEFDGDYILNSVKVKCLEQGQDSYLGDFCFNESAIINPESHILNISVRGPCTLSFIDLSTKDIVQKHACQHSSIHLMSRHSQNFYSHCIEKEVDPPKVHFSIAFKCVDQRYKRSTLLLGYSKVSRRNVDKDRRPTATERRQAVQKISDGISNIFTNLINKADT